MKQNLKQAIASTVQYTEYTFWTKIQRLQIPNQTLTQVTSRLSWSNVLAWRVWWNPSSWLLCPNPGKSVQNMTKIDSKRQTLTWCSRLLLANDSRSLLWSWNPKASPSQGYGRVALRSPHPSSLGLAHDQMLRLHTAQRRPPFQGEPGLLPPGKMANSKDLTCHLMRLVWLLSRLVSPTSLAKQQTIAFGVMKVWHFRRLRISDCNLTGFVAQPGQHSPQVEASNTALEKNAFPKLGTAKLRAQCILDFFPTRPDSLDPTKKHFSALCF